MRIRGISLLLTSLCFILLGCGSQRSHDYLMPGESQARSALEAALGAWKTGKKLGRIDDVKPAIEPMDAKWQAGQQLADFEILSVEPTKGPTKCKVRLIMKTPPGKVEVMYYVLGSDPLWVYREEDYKKLSGG